MASDRILLIDDDTELCNLLTEYLNAEGFSIEAIHDGEQGLERALSDNFTLIVLDVMLPRIGGFDVLRSIRKQTDVPVLMLTARREDVDRIVGLEMGADDYLPKPFNPRELIARIRAILRRVSPDRFESVETSAYGKLVVDDIVLDTRSRRVYRQGEEIGLTAVEFNLLKAMLKSPGQVVSRQDLIKTVLGRDYSPLDRSVDVHISNLRKKLGDKPGEGERIKAIRGEGYLFVVGT